MNKLILFLAILLLSVQAAEAIPVNVTIISPSAAYRGENFSVTIFVNPNGNNITAMQSDFEYDPHNLVINDIREGNLLKSASPTAFNGTFGYGMTYNIWSLILTPGARTKASGTFAVINMTAANSGKFNLALSNVIISDPDSKPVPVYITNSTVSSTTHSILDLNQDGWVNILDLNYIGQHFGERV